MARRCLAALLAALLFVGGLLAADAVVTKFDAKNQTVTLKIGDKETTVDLKDVKVFLRDKEVSDVSKVRFREKQKVQVKEEDGKVTEIRVQGRRP
jgi:hypothetical protein